MYADNAAAPYAPPAHFFFFQEGADPTLLDEFEVFKHAHMVFCPVSLVQVFESPAGVFSAIVTITRLVMTYGVAVLNDAFEA
jgi:hypothetical protein